METPTKSTKAARSRTVKQKMGMDTIKPDALIGNMGIGLFKTGGPKRLLHTGQVMLEKVHALGIGETRIMPDEVDVIGVVDEHENVETPHRIFRGLAGAATIVNGTNLYMALGRIVHAAHQSISVRKVGIILTAMYISSGPKPVDRKHSLTESQSLSKAKI